MASAHSGNEAQRCKDSNSSSGEDFYGHGPPQPATSLANSHNSPPTGTLSTTMPTLTSPLARNGELAFINGDVDGYDITTANITTTAAAATNSTTLTAENLPNMDIFNVGKSGSVLTAEARRRNNNNDDDDDELGSSISSAASSTVGHSSSKTTTGTSGFNNVGFAAMKRVDMYYEVEDVSSATTTATHRTAPRYTDDGHIGVEDMIMDKLGKVGGNDDLGSFSCCDSSGSFPSVKLPLVSTTGQRKGGGAHDDLLDTPPLILQTSGGGGGGGSLRRSNSASMTMFGQGAINIEAARMRKAALRPTIDLASIAQRKQQKE